MIDLNPSHLETVKRILAEHVPDCEVRVFGSRVTWTAKDYSDLDLAIVGPRALDSERLRLLREAFEESDLPFRVDVIDWHAISAAFRKVVEKKYEVVQKGKQNSAVKADRSPISHPQDWKVVRLGQIALKIGSGATPTGGEDSYLASRKRFALIRVCL